MQDHYSMSSMHPTCDICGTSFRGPVELQLVRFPFVCLRDHVLSILKHRSGCPPIITSEAIVDTHSLSDVESPFPQTLGPVTATTGSDGEADDQAEEDMDGAFWETTAFRHSISTSSEGLGEYAHPNVGDFFLVHTISDASVGRPDSAARSAFHSSRRHCRRRISPERELLGPPYIYLNRLLS